MQALGLVTLRSNTYIQETVSLGLVQAVQAAGRLMNSPAIASSLLLGLFLSALTFLPLTWRRAISLWFSYQSGNAIFLCVHDDIISFPLLCECWAYLGFAQVGDLSVTPIELCLHCPQLLIPLLAEGACRPEAARTRWLWHAAGQEEPPASLASSGKASISHICLAEARRACVPGLDLYEDQRTPIRTSVAGSSPGAGVKKDYGSTRGVSLGQRRVLQRNSSLLSAMQGLPGLV